MIRAGGVLSAGSGFLAGSPGDDGGRGAAHLFERGASGYVAVARLSPDSPAGDTEFGYAVALTSRFAVVSAPREPDGPWDGAGAVYVFEDMNPDGDDMPSEWEESRGLRPLSFARRSAPARSSAASPCVRRRSAA